MKAIECRDVSKSFKEKQALDGVSFIMEQGKIYALLGRNGAGKTTLLKCICTKYMPDAGEVFLLEEPAVENQKVLGEVCFMQDYMEAFSIHSVKKILRIAQSFYPKWDTELMKRLLELFEIKETEIYATLSKGRQTAVSLIIGLCSGCDIVLFDEIYSGMDAVARKKMYDLILGTQEERERTLVLSTHLIEEMSGLFTDIILLDHGRVLLTEDMETVRRKSLKFVGRDSQEKFLEGKNVLSRAVAGVITEYYVYDDFTEEELHALKTMGMTVSAMSLTELFIAFTKEA